jgi:hypothetical protein
MSEKFSAETELCEMDPWPPSCPPCCRRSRKTPDTLTPARNGSTTPRLGPGIDIMILPFFGQKSWIKIWDQCQDFAIFGRERYRGNLSPGRMLPD